MKKLTVIPTIHNWPSRVYTPEKLAEYINILEADVIFIELPANKYKDFLKNPDFWAQESKAVKIVEDQREIALFGVEVNCRTELSLSVDFFNEERELNKKIDDFISSNSKLKNVKFRMEALHEKINHIYDETLPTRYRKTKLNKYQRKLHKLYSGVEKLYLGSKKSRLKELFKIQKFVDFDIREKYMTYNCLKHMDSYNRGVLLVGQGHNKIVKKLRKMNWNRDLKIGFLK